MHTVRGGCHCGNISLELQLSRAPAEYNPRACDCDFCRKHGAAYVSDADGALRIWIKASGDSRIYRQGSGAAECLLCGNCGVLIGALYRVNEQIYATVNVKVADVATTFGPQQTVSPHKLSEADKVKRWREIWFSNVALDE